MISQNVHAGHAVSLSLLPHPDGLIKVKAVIQADSAVISPRVQQVLLHVLDQVRGLCGSMVAVDRGHSFSSGIDKVCIWFRPRSTRHTTDSQNDDDNDGDDAGPDHGVRGDRPEAHRSGGGGADAGGDHDHGTSTRPRSHDSRGDPTNDRRVRCRQRLFDTNQLQVKNTFVEYADGEASLPSGVRPRASSLPPPVRGSDAEAFHIGSEGDEDLVAEYDDPFFPAVPSFPTFGVDFHSVESSFQSLQAALAQCDEYAVAVSGVTWETSQEADTECTMDHYDMDAAVRHEAGCPQRPR